MLNTFLSIFKIPDLRQKVLFTLFMVAIFRIGAHIPTPFVNGEELRALFSGLQMERGIFNMVDMFTGGGFSNMALMGLGIMPYISAQIILQLLMVVWPKLEKMKKEGEAGQRKIEQWTRYGTVGLALFQSAGLAIFMVKQDLVMPALADARFLFIPGTVVFTLFAMVAITTGTTLLMWIGEKITQKGVGNGISIIIALGIVAAYPGAAQIFATDLAQGVRGKIWLPVIGVMCIIATVLIILIQEGARKIPIQHARRQVGRKMSQAQTNYLPLKVNTAGVIPVIFSSAILMFPQTVFSFVGADQGTGGMGGLGVWFSPNTPYNLYDLMGIQKEAIFLLLKMFNLYVILYAVLTGFFCFFYTAVMFNPADVADNLKKAGAFIPGYRPGKQTADYIDAVLTRITTVGALFLVSVALIPLVLSTAFNVHYSYAEFAGGTGLIIVVAVVLDTMKRIEAQLLMRHYDGFKIRRQSQDGGSSGGGGGRRWSGRRS